MNYASENRPVRVGISFRTYPFALTTYKNEPEGVEYVRGWAFPSNWFTMKYSILNNHFFFGPPGVDLFHTWNGIVANRRPWLVSFEGNLPWYGDVDREHWLYRWAVQRLQSDDCKAILAACEVAQRRIEAQPWFDENLARKCKVLYYALKRVECISVEKPAEEVRILFVGHDFFRKGGHMLVEAFDRLLTKYSNLRLTVVSRVDYGDYITGAPKERATEYKRRLEEHPKINYIPSIPNDLLLREIMPTADIYAFPTFDETFGICIIEAMSCGVPIIATAIGAIPEMITNGTEGELIKMPTDRFGSITAFNPDLEEHIVRELARILPEWIENPRKRKTMGEAAFRKWKQKFSSEERAEQLTELYRSILDGEFPQKAGQGT